MADLLAAALGYAAAGVYVFPARVSVVDGRKQVTPVARWREASSTTAETLREWFAPGRPWAGASLCIDCGRSELVVVDLDVTGGHDGITAWGALLAEHDVEPTPVRSHTPSGGEHWFYREHPRRVVGIDSSGKVAPGVDVRGLGGFVIAWPSEDARGAYGEIRPADLADIPVVPDLVIERMNRREAPTLEVPVSAEPSIWDTMPRQFTRDEAVEFCRPTFEALRNARDGEINHRLNDAAVTIGHFVPAFWPREHAVRILMDALSNTVYDGRTWRAEATIASGLGANTWRAEEIRVAQRPLQQTHGASERSRTLTAVSADTMTMRTPRWLDEWRIPANAITLLAGREGIGKSTISYNIAARVTRGELSGQRGAPSGVAVVATEDSWEHVILPRLVAAGADLRRVYRVEATDGERVDTVSVPADLAQLGEFVAEREIALIVLDPLMSVIHGSLDTHKDREVRQALDPLARFAAHHDVAVLGLIHVNKTATTDPLTSIMASRAFAAVARSVLYCLADPSADGDGYLYGHAKSNLGPRQPTIAYQIVTHVIPADEPITTSGVEWGDVDVRSIREAMETTREAGRPVGELATDIEAWIADQGRTVSIVEIKEEFGDVKANTIDTNIRRMVERGTLRRVMRGHYVATKRDVSDSVSDTPLETQEAKEVSEVSEVLTVLTLLSSDTSPREVSETAACCKGGVLVSACRLCRESPNYWRDQA